MFSPSRVYKVQETGESFEKPQNFQLSEYLGSTFRVMKGTGEHKVVL